MAEPIAWLALGLLALLAGGLLFSVLIKLQNKRIRKWQLDGLARLQSLRGLLANIQKHRGLTAGYLKGDQSLLSGIQLLQQNTVRDIQAISRLAPDLEDDLRWQNITQHWARLSARFSQNSAENNFEQHNKLVQSLLYLIEDTAEKHYLLKLQHKDVESLRFVWKELLSAVESIGQIRAVGTGVAAAGSCDSISRIRLRYLQQRIEETTGLAWSGLPTSECQRRLIQELMLTIDGKLLGPKPEIDAETYFNQCTQAMDSLYAQYDQTIKQLQVA